MRANPMLDKIRSGSAAIIGQVMTSSSIVAEVFAHQAFDAVLVDLQHGEMDIPQALQMFQAMSTRPVTPMARLPWNDPASIMKLLDAGAYGLICPMVSTREECEAFVQAARYPPLGIRSYGTLRVEMHGDEDYVARSSEEVLTLAMIETADGLRNLDSIMATPGLSGVYVGPSDLSKSMGGPYGSDWRSGEVRDAFDEVIRLATKHGVLAGIYAHTPEYGREMIEAGFHFIVLGTDLEFLKRQAELVLSTIHAEPAIAGTRGTSEI